MQSVMARSNLALSLMINQNSSPDSLKSKTLKKIVENSMFAIA